MFQGAPANNEWLELYAEPAYAQIVGLAGFNAVPRVIEAQLDVTVLGTGQTGVVGIIFFGKAVGWRFLYTDASATTLVTAGSFVTTRSATTKTATNSFTQGKRVVLLGKDDGATVKSYASGTAGATTATWTTAQGAAKLTTDANPFRVGYDGTNYTQLRLHELWVRINGVVCCHIRPKRLYAGTTTIPDLSGNGNDLTISGTEGTNFRFGSVWNEEPAYSGKEALA